MDSTLCVILGMITIVWATHALTLDCEDQGGVFTAEPTDVEIHCKTSTTVEFPCQYTVQSKHQPQWVINSVAFNSSVLPKDHFFDGKTLSVQNIKLEQNNTHYQCLLEVTNSKTGTCVHQSTIGRLIIKCGAPSIQHVIAHYDYELEKLRAISIKITQVEFETSFIITYSKSPSGNECGSASSFCNSESCNNLLEVPSQCTTADVVYLALSVNGSDTKFPLEPIMIDSTNHLIKVSFNEMPSIHCTFINQPKENKKNYAIKYGLAVSGCNRLPIQMKGEISHSNAIVLPLHVVVSESSEICFDVMASNGTKTVTVKGKYKFSKVQSNGATVPQPSTNSTDIVIVATLGMVLVFVGIIWMIKKILPQIDYSDGELSGEYNMSAQIPCPTKDIDLSTTYFKVHPIPEQCFLHEFATSHYPGYQSTSGYGYYQVELKSIINKRHKKLIIMSEDGKTPKYTLFSSEIMKCNYERWSHIYVRDLSLKRCLTTRTNFLYCARSKVVTHRAYWIERNVTEECYELDLVIEKIGGYQTEWSRSQYGYFEFTKYEHIKPHQRVIVKKKNGDLVTGPGIRHIIGAMADSFDKIRPPDFTKHIEWERVYIQSKEINRKLMPGTKYLFCAMMEKIPLTVHSQRYAIKRKCKMADFGRSHIPGFKMELGRGFYEFNDEELLKPHKEVILISKENDLFTGAGAKFFCTKDYTFDQIQKEKVKPPNLEGTEWKHIFIQSHSEERELFPGTEFLYCEYQFLRKSL